MILNQKAKSKITTLLACASITLSGVAAVTPAATAAECVGESKEEPAHSQPIGPGNSYVKTQTVYLNSCEAKALHDEALKNKDGDALKTAVIGLLGEGGPYLAVIDVLGHRITSKHTTSQLREASGNFTHGVKVVLERGQLQNAQPQ